ncbi:DinB family protein [Heyndrickxia camelliae]|uniref:DinB family protein n=1 Tax=Heyndrickxia camelliae TaxID=1707093 RepID=A0A2N3LGJ4_9BACI|nr:DinB family protein [Heyndrickxia camelliae]PKR83752.1 DinB family protein [Heyndrickxia camelliae]
MLKRHEILFNQLESFRQETLHLITNLTDEQVDIVPEGFHNNIRWNLGHIYFDQYLWIKAVTKESIPVPEGFQDWFGFGTKPADWVTPPPRLEELKKLLAEQPKMIRKLYGNRLEEEFSPTELGMHTIAQVLVRTIYHEGMHTETIKLMKRFLNC